MGVCTQILAMPGTRGKKETDIEEEEEAVRRATSDKRQQCIKRQRLRIERRRRQLRGQEVEASM